MRNYNVESKSVHGKKRFSSNYFFYYYLSDNIKKSNRVSASVGHTEHVLINYMVIPEYIRAKRPYYFILQPLKCINGVHKLAASRIISVMPGTHTV